MAYTLQALIGDASDLKMFAPEGAVVVLLPQGKALIPLSESFRGSYNLPSLPLTDGESIEVLADLEFLIKALNAQKLAYVEAELFGGTGTQAAAVWEKGKLILGPIVEPKAINKGLQLLGVTPSDSFDEFEALNLGCRRDTESWEA